MSLAGATSAQASLNASISACGADADAQARVGRLSKLREWVSLKIALVSIIVLQKLSLLIHMFDIDRRMLTARVIGTALCAN